MINMKKIINISIILLLLNNGVYSQEVTAVARLDTSDILIGDQIRLNIKFTMPLDYRVLWPFQKDTLTDKVEIISQSAVDTVISESDHLVSMLQSIIITSFDSGYYRIPPLKFRYQPVDDTVFAEVSSMPSYLRVHTMEVDTSQAIKAIKPPLGAPLTFREMLPWLLMALAALAITLLIVYIISRKKKDKPLFTIRQRPSQPPHVVAIKDLETLRSKKLWQAGKVKDYYTELTDIVRIYIEERFNVNAVEMTTEEILDGMKGTDAGKASIDKLSRTLILADLVKFAKEQPLPVDNDNSLTDSIDFVNETAFTAGTAENTNGLADKKEITTEKGDH